VTVAAEVRPRGPYSLRLTAAGADATRRFRDGVLTAAVRTSGGAEIGEARQRPDGAVELRAATEEGVAALRFVLALDDDHSEFLRRFADDALLGEAVRELDGLRVPRVGTVAQALLRALCGQLITSRQARALEWAIVRATSPALTADGLHAPPTEACLTRFSPAQLRARGLHARRGAALVRICGSVDLERLHGLPTATVVARLTRERGLGDWSAGVICLEGLGRPEQGLVGDLGLMKLLAALRGRWVEPDETRELLAPYDEWAGLASVYLLKGFARGLIPLPGGARTRHDVSRERARRRLAA
jgi:3-methyladenine DNA glycosylase/8-oxoguanine DNA glycosylase